MKHTPGPWRIISEGSEIVGKNRHRATHWNTICKMDYEIFETIGVRRMLPDEHRAVEEECEANARLIAKALKEIVFAIANSDPDSPQRHDAYNEACALIAQIEGGE